MGKKYNPSSDLATYGGECGRFAQVERMGDGWLVYRFKADHFMWRPTDDIVACMTEEQVKETVNAWILSSPGICSVCGSNNHVDLHG